MMLLNFLNGIEKELTVDNKVLAKETVMFLELLNMFTTKGSDTDAIDPLNVDISGIYKKDILELDRVIKISTFSSVDIDVNKLTDHIEAMRTSLIEKLDQHESSRFTGYMSGIHTDNCLISVLLFLSYQLSSYEDLTRDKVIELVQVIVKDEHIYNIIRRPDEILGSTAELNSYLISSATNYIKDTLLAYRVVSQFTKNPLTSFELVEGSKEYDIPFGDNMINILKHISSAIPLHTMLDKDRYSENVSNVRYLVGNLRFEGVF